MGTKVQYFVICFQVLSYSVTLTYIAKASAAVKIWRFCIQQTFIKLVQQSHYHSSVYWKWRDSGLCRVCRREAKPEHEVRQCKVSDAALVAASRSEWRATAAWATGLQYPPQQQALAPQYTLWPPQYTAVLHASGAAELWSRRVCCSAGGIETLDNEVLPTGLRKTYCKIRAFVTTTLGLSLVRNVYFNFFMSECILSSLHKRHCLITICHFALCQV